jgi:Mg2+ and Co2+ transporter CorA
MEDKRHDNGHKMAPLFRRWSYWYLLVIGFLLLLIVLFYLFTKHFS